MESGSASGNTNGVAQRSPSVTIRDVAQQAGVSVATVSRYINGNASVSSAVAERLDKVMAELRFVPDAAARHLHLGKPKQLAFYSTICILTFWPRF